MADSSKKDIIYVENISEEVLEDILVKLERGLIAFLKRRLPPKSEINLLIEAERRGSELVLMLDLTVGGIYGNSKIYSDILEDAVNYGRKLFEEMLGEVSKGAPTEKDVR